MKKIFFLFLALSISVIVNAQTGGFPLVDKSPMDMSYYPFNYPVLKIQDKITDPLVARVIYSRPQKSGRVIFGGLVEYGKIWRIGANEATELEIFSHVRLSGKKLKGKYTLYAIAYETYWTIIVNKDLNTWGSFKYDPKKDVVRIDVPVQKTESPVEYFSMVFEKSATGMNLLIGWDNVKVAVPFTF
jgi:hypothetical protein